MVQVDKRLCVGFERPSELIDPFLGSKCQAASGTLHVDEHRIEGGDVVEPVAEINDITEFAAVPVALYRVEQEINLALELDSLVLEILVKQAVGEPGMVVVRIHGISFLLS